MIFLIINGIHAITSNTGVYSLVDITLTHCSLRDSSEMLNYHQTSNRRRGLIGNELVDNSDVVGASPVGAAPTTS